MIEKFDNYVPEASWWDDINPVFLIDFYKYGHVDQYPKGLKRVVVNFTPRSTRVEGEKGVIFFGLNRFIKKTLIEQFDTYFFSRSWESVRDEYVKVIRATLGVQNPRTDHIEKLHSHGKLPLDIYAVPEGTYVPLGVPAMLIVNNEDWAFWLPNYIETMTSNALWHGCTSASTALRYRKLFLKYAKLAGEKDLSFVDWMGHDFSYRGLSGFDSAVMSGMGHLTAFNGTDTLPAILEAVKYYNAPLNCGGSVPATEHSVMCAGSKESERETFRRLICDVYKEGIVSIVSDTWDLWKVLTEIIPSLKEEILARNGKVVIRPDSGDPVKILTGNSEAWHQGATFQENAEYWGALWCLAHAIGIDGPVIPSKEEGYWKLRKMGLIYGDSITVERADQILSRSLKNGFSPYNYVFGIGSFTYQYVTRDTYNFAFKATAIQWEDGRWEAIYKDPVTDNAHKKSHHGIPVPTVDAGGNIVYRETLIPGELDSPSCIAKKVFNGDLLIDPTFDEIRARVRAYAD